MVRSRSAVYPRPVTELERFARRLRDEPGLSRNRRYDELSQPHTRDLRRRLRRLEGIVQELRTAQGVSLHADGEGYRLVLHFPSVRLRRETHLSSDEHALLVRGGHLLRMAVEDTPDAA